MGSLFIRFIVDDVVPIFKSLDLNQDCLESIIGGIKCPPLTLRLHRHILHDFADSLLDVPQFRI